MSKVLNSEECVLEQGYPEIAVQEGVVTMTLQYAVTPEFVMEKLPLTGTFLDGADLPAWAARYSRLKLSNYSVKPKSSGKLLSLQMVYTDENNNDSDTTVRQTVEYDTQDEVLALERLPNYRTCWNYCLCAKAGYGVPSWWGTATDTVIPASDQGNYEWIKPGDRTKNSFVIIKAEVKPGVEGKQTGTLTVHVTQRCANLGKLVRSARKDYTIQDPPEDFDRPGEWLRGGSKIVKSGRMWELAVDYKNAQTIDRDLYQ
ncbi:MAG: hypothetical protein J6W00_10890 [Lentisphaeria bacterium]|nr:hypothetical protein [Lentisphaeria bacterium]